MLKTPSYLAKIIIVKSLFLFSYIKTFASVSQINVKQYVKIMQNQALNITQQDIKDLVQDLFIQSITDSILGQNEKAYESLVQAIKLDPANACIHYKLAQVLHKLPHLANKKRFIADSYTHIYAAIELSNKTKWYYYTAIEMHKNSTEYNNACLLYEDMFQHFPPTSQDLLNLAHLYMQEKDYRQAIRVYSHLEQKIGITQQIVKEKHAAFLAMNEIEMAITDAMKLASQFPDNEDYIINLADLLFENGQSGTAIQYLKSHFSLYPTHLQALLYLTGILLDLGKSEEGFMYAKILFKSTSIPLDKKLEILDKYIKSISENNANLPHDELADILIDTYQNNLDVYNTCSNMYLILGYQKKYLESNEKVKQLEK